jgi:GntR family transcriptional repressor for pyruvate dehydrogenase complex
MFEPVRRQSVSDAVFRQLRDQIVSGTLVPGEPLPAERALCEVLGVNRGAVREALRRLEQARLVSVRHGGTSQVLDFRQAAGLDLLADLVLRPSGDLDAPVIRSLVEMRSAIAPDVARLAALRGGTATAERLDVTVSEMESAGGDLARLQPLSLEFWSALIDDCDNLAYRLAYNTLQRVYERASALVVPLLAEELRALAEYTRLAAAVRTGDGARAERVARRLVGRGEAAIRDALGEGVRRDGARA